MDNDDSEHLESLHFLSLEVQPKTYRERGWGTATVIGEADSRERLSGLLLLNGKAGGGGVLGPHQPFRSHTGCLPQAPGCPPPAFPCQSCLCEITSLGLSFFQPKGPNKEFTWPGLLMRELRLGGRKTWVAPHPQQIQAPFRESLLSEGEVSGTGVGGWGGDGWRVGKQ